MCFFSVFKIFDLQSSAEIVFDIVDNQNILIELADLKEIVLQYKFCSNFFIEIVLEDNSLLVANAEVYFIFYFYIHTLKPNLKIIVFQRIRSYMLENEKEHLIEEYEKLPNKLPKRFTSDVAHVIFDYVLAEYSIRATPDEISGVCKAVVELFPTLKADPSEIGGIVS